MPDKLIIKNAKLRLRDFLFVGGLVAVLLVSIVDGWSIWSVLFIGFLLGVVLFTIIARIKDSDPQIVIDQRGIEFCEENKFFPWNTIQYAFIRSEIINTGESTTTVDFLVVVTKRGEVKKQLDNYDYSKSNVKEAVEGFSGRNIGDPSDQVRDEMLVVLDSHPNTQEILQLFGGYLRRTRIATSALFLSILGIAIYFQIVSVFVYSLGVGFILCNLSPWLYREIGEINFRKRSLINTLSKAQYDSLAVKQQVKLSKKQLMNYRIFVLVLSVLIFAFSYLAAI